MESKQVTKSLLMKIKVGDEFYASYIDNFFKPPYVVYTALLLKVTKTSYKVLEVIETAEDSGDDEERWCELVTNEMFEKQINSIVNEKQLQFYFKDYEDFVEFTTTVAGLSYSFVFTDIEEVKGLNIYKHLNSNTNKLKQQIEEMFKQIK